MVQIAIPYAYGHTIWVYAYGIYHAYAYGMKYAYGTQQLLDELSDNNALDDGLSLSASVAVNKQIFEVIPMPGS